MTRSPEMLIEFLLFESCSLEYAVRSPLSYSMQVKINGEPQKSFEQFQETFRQAFGDMTPDVDKWLRLANFSNDSLERRHSTDDAA